MKKGSLSTARCAPLFILTMILSGVSTTAATAGTCVNLDGERKDTNTKIPFPHKRVFSGVGELVLAGVGSRVKAYVVTVYSVGLYAEKSKVAAAGQDGKTAAKTLLDGGGRLAVALTFYMGVGAKKVAEALAAVSGVEKEIIVHFQEMLIQGMAGSMNKNESMTIEWTGKDSIVVTVRGNKIGDITNAALAKGLLEMYLGKQAVSPAMLKDIEVHAPMVATSLC
jgi:hypothetical protein